MVNKRKGKDRRKRVRADDSERRDRMPAMPIFKLDWIMVGLCMPPVILIAWGLSIVSRY